MFRKGIFFCVFFISLTAAPLSLKPPLTKLKAAKPSFEPCEPRAVLKSAQPCSGCGDLFISGSLLMWQTKLWGLEFAAKSYLPNVAGANVQNFEEKLYVPDFAWRPGFKLLLGSHIAFDGWDIRVGWTAYQEKLTHLKKHFDMVTQPDGIGIVPLWHYPFLEIVGGNEGNPLRYADASVYWRMRFNTFDLELGRYFFPEQPLPMRLKIGAKIASIHQKYQAHYNNGTTILAISPQDGIPSLFQFVSSQFRAKSYQWGMGPRLGLESRWNVYSGINLIGHGAFSILCSFFDIKSQYDDLIQSNPGSCHMQMKEHFHELAPVCEAMLGLDWGTCFWNQLYFGFTLGYEWQYWWSVNHLRRQYVQTLPGETFDMRGELQMQGLNAAFTFDF